MFEGSLFLVVLHLISSQLISYRSSFDDSSVVLVCGLFQRVLIFSGLNIFLSLRCFYHNAKKLSVPPER